MGSSVSNVGESWNDGAVEAFDEYQKTLRASDASPDERKRSFTAILNALAINANELAGRVGVAPITVQRWLTGIAPRAALLEKLGEVCRGRSSAEVPASVLGSNKPVPFGEAAAGLWDVRHFFERAKASKRIYVFKTFIPFHAASSITLQENLLELLADDPTREIHYFYPKNSDTEESFEQLKEMLLYREREEVRRIIGHYVDPEPDQTPSSDPIPMNAVLAQFMRELSPFVLELNKEETKVHGRLVEVLLEVPVQSYERSGEITDFARSRPRVWIEFPHFLAHKIWLDVRDALYNATGITTDVKGNPSPPLEEQLRTRYQSI